jgi:hypothetical protein
MHSFLAPFDKPERRDHHDKEEKGNPAPDLVAMIQRLSPSKTPKTNTI